MFPGNPFENAPDIYGSHTKFDSPTGGITLLIRTASNISDLLVGQFRCVVPFAAHVSVSLDHIGRVLGWSAFDNVPWIKTQRNIARMPSMRNRPMPMSQIESETMSLDESTFKADNSSPIRRVSSPRSCEGPEQTFIGSMVTQSCEEPLQSVKIWRHLRSFIARVWGECAFTSGSPFVLYQMVTT